MLDVLVRTGARLRLLVVLIVAAVVAGGVLILRDASVDALPELAPPYVEIQTEALGLSATEVEELITVPLEANMLSGVAWVESISSRSVAGLSSIILTFEEGTDLLRARQVVQERLTQAHALPRVSKPPTMLQPLSSSSRVMMISLTSADLSLVDLGVLTRWTIRPRLMGVDGVANVAVWGQRERQLQVQVDPVRLNANGVTLEQVVRSAGNALWVSPLSYLDASTPGAGGFIETPNQRLGVRHVQPITTPEDLAAVSIEGSSRRLGDVTEVVENHQPLIGEANTSEGGGLLLVVERFPEADVMAVTGGVEGALAALGPGLDGVTVDSSVYRAADFIGLSARNVGLAVLLGLLAAIATLLLLGCGWRRTTVAVIAMAATVTVGALAAHVGGGTIDGIAVAALVGVAAVTLGDAAAQLARIQQDLDGRSQTGAEERAHVAASTTLEARAGTGYLTAIGLLVLVPLFALQGVGSALFAPFVVTFAAGLVTSGVVGYLAIPALAAIVMRPSRGGRSPRAQRFARGYRRVVGHLMPRFGIAAAGVGALVLAIAALTPLLRADLVPQFGERNLVVTIRAEPGSSGPASGRIVDELRAELLELDGVRDVVGQVGRAVMSDQLSGVDTSQLWISLKPDGAQESTFSAVHGVLRGYASLQPSVDTYLGQRTAGLAPTPGDRVIVRVFGPDAESLKAQAAVVRDEVADVPGVTEATVEETARAPQVEIEVDVQAAGRHGLTPGQVRRAASTLISGIEVGSLFEDQKVFDVVVWGVPALRESVDTLGSLLIDTPDGEQVPLAEVAGIRVEEADGVIDREGISRRLVVTASIAGDAVAVAGAIEERVRQLDFPIEYHAEVDRSQIAARSARDAVVGLSLAVLVGIVLLYQAAFDSWRLAALGLAVPLAATAGGLLAVGLTGGVVSVGSIVGLLVLAAYSAGLSVRVVTDLGRSIATSNGEDAAAGAGPKSLAALPMISLPMAALLLPCAFLSGLPGLEIVGRMGTVLLGGVLTSALASTLLMPAIAQWPGSRGRPRMQAIPIRPLAKPEPARTT